MVIEVKNSPANEGDMSDVGFFPWVRKIPGIENGNLLQYSCLENSMDRGAGCQCRRQKRCEFDPWVMKFLWRRAWQLTPGFLPGKFHGQRSLVGYSSWGCKELDMTEVT